MLSNQRSSKSCRLHYENMNRKKNSMKMDTFTGKGNMWQVSNTLEICRRKANSSLSTQRKCNSNILLKECLYFNKKLTYK